MLLWTLCLPSADTKQLSNLGRGMSIWNNSFDSVDETAGCYGKNIEIVLFLRNIFCGTETINNKEREQSFLSIKVWV